MIKEKEYFILNLIDNFDENGIKYLLSTLRFHYKGDTLKKLEEVLLDGENHTNPFVHIVFSHNVIKENQCIIDHIVKNVKGIVKVVQLPLIDLCENENIKSLTKSIFTDEKFLSVEEDSKLSAIFAKTNEMNVDKSIKEDTILLNKILNDILE